MQKIKEIMASLGVKPKLRLGRKKPKGGVESLGPVKVKFLAEPDGITGKDFEGKPTKFLRFLVAKDGNEYHWFVRVLNKEGQPNYLLERLSDIEIGGEYILEMKAQGGRNHVEITTATGEPITTHDEEGPVDDDEQEDNEGLGL